MDFLLCDLKRLEKTEVEVLKTLQQWQLLLTPLEFLRQNEADTINTDAFNQLI